MPKSISCGVEARLTGCDFQESLSDVVNLRMGQAQQDDMKRTRKVLEEGVVLQERPIGQNGSERGVVQYLGEYEDMPLFMVEAGDELLPPDGEDQDEKEEGATPCSDTPAALDRSLSSVMDSPLSSLGPTPVFGTPTESLRDAVQSEDWPWPRDTLADQAARRLYLQREQQALRLTINTTAKTHVLMPGKKLIDTDLKIEIFCNGRLADVDFINTKRNGAELNTKTTEGVRIHRQIEKPWVYLRGGALSPSNPTAQERWMTFSDTLRDEATGRGLDRRGNPPPTAAFLHALANIALPDRLADKARLGVIDVVITTGIGFKHGPSRGYITAPTPMESKSFSTGVARPAYSASHRSMSHASESHMRNSNFSRDDPFYETLPKHHASAQYADASNSSNTTEALLPSTSSDVPLAERSRAASLTAKNLLSSPKATRSETKSPFSSPRSATPADSLEALQRQLAETPGVDRSVSVHITSRGKVGKVRPLSARLGDIKQMLPGNREKAIHKLREELGLSAAPRSAIENVAAFREELSSNVGWEKLVVEPSTNQRGEASGAHTLEERLGHVKKMTPANSLKAIQALREDFGLVKSEGPSRSVSTRSSDKYQIGKADTPIQASAMVSPKKSSKISQTVENEDDDMLDAPHELDPDPPSDQIAMLAQARTDMAIDLGASPQGRLLDRIASLSPHRTPTKKTPTPQRGSQDNYTVPLFRRDSTMAVQTPSKGSTPEYAGNEPPRKKIRRKSTVPEQTPEEALASFKLPKICQGCAVSYAGGNAQRQVPKSRPGSFEEQQVVVGFRFVVI